MTARIIALGLALAGALFFLAPDPPARAQPRLAVGACVVADKLHPGRITQVLPYGYVVKGFGPNDSPMMWPFADVVSGPCPAAAAAGERPGAPARAAQAAAPEPAGGACFASDAPSGSGLDGRVRAVLVNGFAHSPRPGEDGRITVHVDALRIGASHPASPVDQVQFQTPAGRTIYDVRATFETCTDYNRRSVFVRRERNFVCFTKASGVFDCSMTANSPGLARDSTREVPK